MILLQGKGVSKGVTSGPIYFFRRSDATVTKYDAPDQAAEKERLAAAQESPSSSSTSWRTSAARRPATRLPSSLRPTPCSSRTRTTFRP